MTDLVVISLEPWDEMWRRNQHVLARLLNADEDLRVLFVEPVADPLDALRRGKFPARGLGLRGVRDPRGLSGTAQDRLWLSQDTKILPRKIAPRWDEAWARKVVRQAHVLGMERPILWVNDPRGALVMADTGWPTLYDVTDDWVVAERPSPERRRTLTQEQQLLAGAEIVVVCSRELQQRKRGARGSLRLIGNAVDLEPYRSNPPRPEDLPPGVVVLYAGTVHPDRVDTALLEDLAQHLARREVSTTVVLLGPCLLENATRAKLEDVGILVLGRRPPELVPSYLLHADVLLVPHVLTEFTASLDPIKAYEYRAAGRPVVSTEVPGFADVDDPLVAVRARDDFAAAVEQSLQAPAHRTTAGHEVPTWDQRAAQFRDVLLDLRRGAV